MAKFTRAIRAKYRKDYSRPFHSKTRDVVWSNLLSEVVEEYGEQEILKWAFRGLTLETQLQLMAELREET